MHGRAMRALLTSCMLCSPQYFPALANAHLEKRRGTVTEARDYCRKEDTREAGPFEVGTHTDGQGERSDLDTYAAAVRRLAAEGLTWKTVNRQLAEDYPAMHLRYSRHADQLYKASVPEFDDGDFEPYPWQDRIITAFKEAADSRTIWWVYDEEGGKGKSRLAAHLVSKYDGIVLGGKLDDMKYAFAQDISKVAIFDLTRTQADCIKHLVSFAESLKNGMFMSTKYESRMVTFPRPHVIFFANFTPPEGVWSSDRLKLLNLAEEEL